jgi:hypothetical protein
MKSELEAVQILEELWRKINIGMGAVAQRENF